MLLSPAWPGVENCHCKGDLFQTGSPARRSVPLRVCATDGESRGDRLESWVRVRRRPAASSGRVCGGARVWLLYCRVQPRPAALGGVQSTGVSSEISRRYLFRPLGAPAPSSVASAHSHRERPRPWSDAILGAHTLHDGSVELDRNYAPSTSSKRDQDRRQHSRKGSLNLLSASRHSRAKKSAAAHVQKLI